MISPIFDWWIIPHLAFFIWLGSTIGVKWPKWSYWIHLLWILPVAFGWEIAEHLLQRAYPDAWSGVIEHWANAWVVDPFSDWVGAVIGIAVGKWSKNRKLRK